ncbi:MAG: signal peptidase II [Pseudomonadota bacterium]
MQNKYLKQIIGFGLIIDIIILDQLTKWGILEYIMRPLAFPESQPLGLFTWIANAPERFPTVSTEILPFFNLTMVWNQGVSFGLFQSGNPWPLIILASGISVFFAFWLARAQTWGQAIALGCVIGGALGNVIDRLRFGAVADFFDFHVMGWHYPAFNIADSCITLGIAFLIFDGIVLEPKRKRTNITT